ncbi:MAG: RNA polymerase sigma-70 factor [Mucilaginibacter sp.]|uniref:RNA polymerase sigma-70 factor n=1 Tax=Mucilaginibacter sp. TaxID=1882438 RepID=UPI003263D396
MRDFEKLSDEELSVLLSKEVTAAFHEIFNRYWSQLYTTAYRRVRSREAAEEIVQDLFTSLWVKRKNTRIHTSLAAYLFTSVRYLVLNHVEKEAVRKTYKDSLQVVKTVYQNPTEETVLLNDLTRKIEEEIDLLPLKCRSVFELSRKEYKTNKEIAVMLGISEKTVENHLTKALTRLRLSLNDVISLTFIIWFANHGGK